MNLPNKVEFLQGIKQLNTDITDFFERQWICKELVQTFAKFFHYNEMIFHMVKHNYISPNEGWEVFGIMNV